MARMCGCSGQCHNLPYCPAMPRPANECPDCKNGRVSYTWVDGRPYVGGEWHPCPSCGGSGSSKGDLSSDSKGDRPAVTDAERDAAINAAMHEFGIVFGWDRDPDAEAHPDQMTRVLEAAAAARPAVECSYHDCYGPAVVFEQHGRLLWVARCVEHRDERMRSVPCGRPAVTVDTSCPNRCGRPVIGLHVCTGDRSAVTVDMVEAAHRTALDLGWTCIAHEPLDYGDCGDCNEGLDRLATQMLEAALEVAPEGAHSFEEDES